MKIYDFEILEIQEKTELTADEKADEEYVIFGDEVQS